MLVSTPAPSPVLAELAARVAAAATAYDTKLDRYRVQHFPDDSPRHVAERFLRTETGAKLSKTFSDAERRYRDATQFGDALTIAGQTWPMHDLSQTARDAVYRAAADHGFNTDAWPAKVRDEMTALLSASPRPPTFGEVAESRHQALMSRAASVDAVLGELGTNPSAWTDAAIDRVALAYLRADAFAQLVMRARSLDAEWSARAITEPGTMGNAGRVELERQQMQADISVQQDALLGAINGLHHHVKTLRTERQRWADSERAGQATVAPDAYVQRDAEIAQAEQRLKAAQERFARWQSTPDEQKAEIYNEMLNPEQED